MDKNICRIKIGTYEQEIAKKDFELIEQIKACCLAKSRINAEFTLYQEYGYESPEELNPRMGVYISPESSRVEKLQVNSFGLEELCGLETLDRLNELDLRNNNIKELSVPVCDILFANKGQLFVNGTLIPSKAEKGLKTAGLFCSWYPNNKYYTIDFDLYPAMQQ